MPRFSKRLACARKSLIVVLSAPRVAFKGSIFRSSRKKFYGDMILGMRSWQESIQMTRRSPRFLIRANTTGGPKESGTLGIPARSPIFKWQPEATTPVPTSGSQPISTKRIKPAVHYADCSVFGPRRRRLNWKRCSQPLRSSSDFAPEP